MRSSLSRKLAASILTAVLCLNFSLSATAQSKRQTPPAQTPTGDGKKNQRESISGATNKGKDAAKSDEQIEKEAGVIEVDTNIVNVEVVVYNKKNGQIVTGLKQNNFAIFEDGKKQEITNFSTPEAPITVSLILEYSKLSEALGFAGSRGFEDGKLETVRPVALFLTQFIKPPNDYASVIAFDIRPTPITDFTNDPSRISQTISLLLRNNPAFRDSNLFDALKFTIVGGKGDSVVLEDSKERTSEYAGMQDIKSRRKAIILVASGIDTFSKINLDQVRKIIQEAGIPIYILSTGELYYKLYEPYLPPTDSITGAPGRLTFMQAKNQLQTFARESGGAYYPITFQTEIPDALRSINALMRNQYSLAYEFTGANDGKKRKLQVKVDINGDGQFEEKDFVVQHRPFYVPPKAEGSKK